MLKDAGLIDVEIGAQQRLYALRSQPLRRLHDWGAPILVSVTFDEENGRTRVTSHTTCPSKDVRDGIIASGMERGMRESMDRLETLIAELADDSGASA